MHAVVIDNATVLDQVRKLRERFREMRFCFSGDEYDDLIQTLHQLIA
jgi:hypothetical protein